MELIEQFLKKLDEEIEANTHEIFLKEYKHKSQVQTYEERVDKLHFLLAELEGLTKSLKTLPKNSNQFAIMVDSIERQKYKKELLIPRIEYDFYRCEFSTPLNLAILKAIHETMVRFAKEWRDILTKAKPESKEPVR